MNQISNYIKRFTHLQKQIEPLFNSHYKNSEVKNIKDMLVKASENNVTVLVCGEFKRGKSSFINAFLNEYVCPEDAGIATSVVSIIRYGAERKVYRYYGEVNNLQSDEITFEDIEKYAKGSALEVDNTIMLVIELPTPKLKDGLTIIDTPGVGGLDPRHLFLTLYALPKSDVTFFVLDAGEPLSTTELDFYRDKILPYSKCNKIILNKSDMKTSDELTELIEDSKHKIAEHCSIDLNAIEIMPVSSAHWIMYNKTQNIKLQETSNCKKVNEVLSQIVPTYQTALLQIVKSLMFDTLCSIEQNISFQLSQIQAPDEEERELFNNRLLELKQIKDDIVNPTSETRKKIAQIIKSSQTSVINELNKQSILFSTECLDNILSRAEAKEDNGGEWVLQQINLGLESLSAEVDLKIEAGIEQVNAVLGEEITVTDRDFIERISADLTPAEKSIADKACTLAKHTLPGLGVSALGNIALGLLFGPVTAAIGGLAAGAAFIYKTNKDANTTNRIYQLKNKLAPQITIAMNDLKSYVQQRYDDFSEALILGIENMTNDVVSNMQDVIDALRCVDNDKKEADKQTEQLEGQITFINNNKKQIELLLTNPFEK